MPSTREDDPTYFQQKKKKKKKMTMHEKYIVVEYRIKMYEWKIWNDHDNSTGRIGFEVEGKSQKREPKTMRHLSLSATMNSSL